VLVLVPVLVIVNVLSRLPYRDRIVWLRAAAGITHDSSFSSFFD
jgi:hypothetical protein